METKETSVKRISCENCGADLVFDINSQMTNCNFCGSHFAIERAVEETIISPDLIIPFKVSKENYLKAIDAWMSQGEFTPVDVLSSSKFSSMNGTYIPMFYYTGKFTGNWTASSGYYVEEKYLEKDSSGELVNRTRTVTKWTPVSANCDGNISDLGFAGPDNNLKPEVIDFANGTLLTNDLVKNYDPSYTLGFNMLDYAVSEEDAWNRYALKAANARVQESILKSIPGDEYRDLVLNLSFQRDPGKRVYAPYWIAYYKYAGKEYTVCMDGTNPSRVIGQRPVDESMKKKHKGFFKKAHISLAIVVLLIILNSTVVTTGSPLFGNILLFIILGVPVTIILYIVSGVQRRKLIKEAEFARQYMLNAKKK